MILEVKSIWVVMEEPNKVKRWGEPRAGSLSRAILVVGGFEDTVLSRARVMQG